uniref:Corticotropin-releasing factor domain-containing protein n=1 Tax=Anas zonorhyncha TaxID=75864 RepID=A0A8B9V8K8_9AVES
MLNAGSVLPAGCAVLWGAAARPAAALGGHGAGAEPPVGSGGARSPRTFPLGWGRGGCVGQQGAAAGCPQKKRAQRRGKLGAGPSHPAAGGIAEENLALAGEPRGQRAGGGDKKEQRGQKGGPSSGAKKVALSLDVPTHILKILLDLAREKEMQAKAAANAELMDRIGRRR